MSAWVIRCRHGGRHRTFRLRLPLTRFDARLVFLYPECEDFLAPLLTVPA